jgi:hypothetical protein
MKQVVYEDDGRKFLVTLPDDVPDDQAHMGVVIGPPPIVDALRFPEPFATRLHNTLFDRKLWSIKEVQQNPNALRGALQKALRVDIHVLLNAYNEIEKEPHELNGS